MNWLKRMLGGGSDSSSESAEPAGAPEPAATPSEPAAMPSEPPADAGTGADEPAGDDPA